MNKALGYIYLVLTFVIWGSLYVAAKSVMTQLPPLALLSTRYIIAIVVLYFMMRKRGFKKVKKEHRKVFFAIGAVGYFGGIAFQLVGTNMLDASLASLINSLAPVAIPIIAAIFLNEKIYLKTVISIVLSVIGVYIILGVGGNASVIGIVINILSLLFWCTSSCIVRSIANEYDPIQITLYAMAIALCFNIPTTAYSIATTDIALSWSGLASIIYIGIVCTALANIFWNRSLMLLPASTCSLFYPIQPLTSSVLAIVILGEKITVSFVIGAVIICVSMAVTLINPKKK